jgi:hypothetical protein
MHSADARAMATVVNLHMVIARLGERWVLRVVLAKGSEMKYENGSLIVNGVAMTRASVKFYLCPDSHAAKVQFPQI